MADTGMDVNYLGAFDEFDLDTGTIVDTEGRATRPRYVLTVWDIDAGGDEAHYTFWATATDLSKYRVRSGRGLPVPIWRSPENYQFYNYDPWDDLTRNPPRCIYDIQTWIAIGDFLRWVKRNYAPPESLSIWSMPMSADTDGGYYLLPLLKMPWGEKVAEEFYALRSPPSTYFWRHPPASSDRFDYKPPDWIASNGALFVYNDYDPWEHLAA